MSDSIKLVSKGGSTSIYIDMSIDEDGNLLFSGQDIGSDPEAVSYTHLRAHET